MQPEPCLLCHNTGWRTVQRNGREGVERCDHKPAEQDAKQRAAGDSGGEAA